jgi:hypothetical protein
MPADPLDPILAHAAIDTPLARRGELEALSRKISQRHPDEFIDAAARVCGLSWDDGRPRPPGYYEIHGQHWWIDLSTPDNRQHLLTAVMAATLADALDLTLSPAWVAQVIPAVLTIESVTITDASLQFHLRRHPTPLLPSHLQDTVNPTDHAEFLDAIAAITTQTTSASATIHISDP